MDVCHNGAHAETTERTLARQSSTRRKSAKKTSKGISPESENATSDLAAKRDTPVKNNNDKKSRRHADHQRQENVRFGQKYQAGTKAGRHGKLNSLLFNPIRQPHHHHEGKHQPVKYLVAIGRDIVVIANQSRNAGTQTPTQSPDKSSLPSTGPPPPENGGKPKPTSPP